MRSHCRMLWKRSGHRHGFFPQSKSAKLRSSSFAVATMFQHLTYKEAIERGLQVMDTSAISLCWDNKLPIYVFNLRRNGNIMRVLVGERVGTLVSNEMPTEWA